MKLAMDEAAGGCDEIPFAVGIIEVLPGKGVHIGTSGEEPGHSSRHYRTRPSHSRHFLLRIRSLRLVAHALRIHRLLNDLGQAASARAGAVGIGKHQV